MIFMYRPVEYLTGRESKLTFRTRLIFLSLISPMVIARSFFLLLISTLYTIQQQTTPHLIITFWDFSQEDYPAILLPWICCTCYKQQMEEEKPQEVQFGKFNIFLLTKTAQNSYGLKNGDYPRYRRYCGRKVHKLRHALGIKYGTKMKFIKRDPLQEKPNDPRILQLTLFMAEKNWALANQSKLSDTRKPAHKARGRIYAVKKLIKAVEWAQKLEKVCKEHSEKVTQLESQAYRFWLQGSLQFERGHWGAAQKLLIACRQMMPDLGRVSDSLSEKVFREKVDQIEQTIRFCDFKISKGKQLSITEIVELRKDGDPSLANLMDSMAQQWMADISLKDQQGQVRFGTERYPLKEEQIVKQKAKIEAAQANLQAFKTKWLSNIEDDKLYEQLLSLFSELVIQVEEAVRLCDSQRQDPKKRDKYTQGQLEILKKVGLLFGQTKLKLFVDRNLVIFKASHELNKGRRSTPQTLAKLLTNTMTLLQELAALTKQKAQIGNAFDIQQIQVIDAQIFYLRTLRLMFVGQVYFNNQKLKEAHALWQECQRCTKILLSKQQMNEQDPFIGCLVSLEALTTQIRTNLCISLISHFNQENSKNKELTENIKQIRIEEKPEEQIAAQITLESVIADNKEKCPYSLDAMSKIPIVDLPGRMQPIPTRPIFFDIFSLNLTYPSVESKLKKEPQKTSWWGRLFK